MVQKRITQHKSKRGVSNLDQNFFIESWATSWTYIKTVVDVLREPVLILDQNLCVLAANEAFLQKFQVDLSVTEGVLVYKLGNGQWDIPDLRRLLEDILPQNTFFKGFQVSHDFPAIGRKIMILNARQIFYQADTAEKQGRPIILLAIEDVTSMMSVAESLASQATDLDTRFEQRAKAIETKLVLIESLLQKLNLSSPSG